MSSENMTVAGDGFSVLILLGWFVSALPAVATLLTIVWMGIRIYETDTVQKWLGKKHDPYS